MPQLHDGSTLSKIRFGKSLCGFPRLAVGVCWFGSKSVRTRAVPCVITVWGPLQSRPVLRSESQSRIGLLLFALVLVAYLPALQCGFIWDDDDYVIENPVLRTAAGLWQLWTDPSSLPQYYPLVHTMFWIEFQLWGLEPFGYHLVNILLHATSAVLLWRLLASLSVPAALLIAALFAVHPVQVYEALLSSALTYGS